MLGLNFRRSIEIGNGARDFKNAVVCASTQTLLLHRSFKQALAVAGEFAIRANLAGAHLGIAEDAFACRSKAVELHFTCAQDTLSNRGGIFGSRIAPQFLIVRGGHVDVDVDSVHEGTRDLRDVALDHFDRAFAGISSRVVELAAGLWVRSL